MFHRHDFYWYEKTCSNAALKGNLNALKYMRSKGCEWDKNSLINVIQNGHFHVVEYCLANDCPMETSDVCQFAIDYKDHEQALRMLKLLRNFSVPWNIETCNRAASAGNLTALKWAVSEGCSLNLSMCAYNAAESGNIEILEWIKSRGGNIWDAKTCAKAAIKGNLETLKWLRSNCCPWDEKSFLNAFKSGDFETIQYCIEHCIEGMDLEYEFYDHDEVYEYVMGNNCTDSMLVMKLLRMNGYPWNEQACTYAVRRNKFKLLRWLKYKGCPWHEEVCDEAVKSDNLEILVYARENGCPWSYETYAYCFSMVYGLDAEYNKIPIDRDHECSDEIFQYLKKHNCPQPKPSDWRIIPS